MAFTYDPEVAAILAALASSGSEVETPERGDYLALRSVVDAGLGAMFARLPANPGVTMTSHFAQSEDGTRIPLSTPAFHTPPCPRRQGPRRPGAVRLHGQRWRTAGNQGGTGR